MTELVCPSDLTTNYPTWNRPAARLGSEVAAPQRDTQGLGCCEVYDFAAYRALFLPDHGIDMAISVKGRTVLFSEIDLQLVSSINWRLMRTGPDQSYEYVCAFVEGREILMHRLLLGATGKQKVDHINGNTLDNRRSNLRVCTHGQNMKNRRRNKNAPTEYKGVSQTQEGSWYARIKVNSVKYRSKRYATPREAALAYDELARRHHGEFARLNFPEKFFDLRHPQSVGKNPVFDVSDVGGKP